MVACERVVGTLSQSDYTGVACARVVGTLSQSDYTGVVHKGCMCRGCTQGLHMQGLCTRVVHAGVACKGCRRKGGGDTQPIRLHRGCTQGLHMQGCWGHSANLITQGLRARVAHAGVGHAGVACKGCLHRGCMQGVHAQGLRTQGLLFVLGYHCLPLTTIDLVGDNREFEV